MTYRTRKAARSHQLNRTYNEGVDWCAQNLPSISDIWAGQGRVENDAIRLLSYLTDTAEEWVLQDVAQRQDAIDPRDALSWHHASQLQAGIAERAGFRVRALPGRGWEVWATDADFGELVLQAGGDPPSRLLLQPLSSPTGTAAAGPAAPPRRPPSAGGAATSFDQADYLELLRSGQMLEADYLALCDENGWDRMWGLVR
jgi:hypothetical protein